MTKRKACGTKTGRGMVLAGHCPGNRINRTKRTRSAGVWKSGFRLYCREFVVGTVLATVAPTITCLYHIFRKLLESKIKY